MPSHFCWVFAALVFSSCGALAHAQVDTPAAREARAALRSVQESFGKHPGWAPWLRQLALEDVEFELRAGDSAEQATLLWTAARLRGGSTSHFRWPSLQKLATALEARAEELEPVPAAEWPQACKRQAEEHKTITAQAVQQSRQNLQDRLYELEQRLPSLRNPKDQWRGFLRLSETHGLVTNDRPNPETLDLLETRWLGAPSVWESPELVETALAAQAYIRLYRGYLANETKEEHAAAWTELGKLLATRSQATPGDLPRIAAMVSARERLGQSSPLTASIRREFSRPNIILRARADWLQSQMSSTMSDGYDIDDVFAGARTRGRGNIAGRTRIQIFPSTAVGQAMFHLDGATKARTVGYGSGVSVSSRATTRFRGEKLFTLDARGLHSEPARSSANAAVVYDNVSAGGGRRRRAAAVSQAYATIPQAEAEAEAATRRSIAEQMNSQGKDLVARFNKTYHLQLRNPQFEKLRPAPQVRVRAGGQLLTWECRLESPLLFAAPAPPPRFEQTGDVVLSLAASALQEQCVGSLAGRQLSGEELAKVIGELLGEASPSEKGAQEFQASFAEQPCEIQLASGQLLARFFITSFDSSDVQYPAMTVDATYNVTERAGDLALVREGSLRVRPMPQADGRPPTTSGRQQALRLAVQRKLNKAFADTFIWTSPVLSTSDQKRDTAKLRVERAQVDGGWLQMSLKRS